MPNQQPILITQIVEDIVVELPATPYTKHIEVPEDGGLDGFGVDGGVFKGAGHEHVGGDVVAAAHEQGDVVEDYGELAAVAGFVGGLRDGDRPDAVAEGFCEDGLVVLLDGDGDVVEEGSADIPRPP